MKISKSQYYSLIGLNTLAQSYNGKLKDILLAVEEITKEGSDYGHGSDMIFGGDLSVDDLLKRLKIEVE